MKRKMLCMIFALCLLLGGCRKAPAQRRLSSQIVREITVTGQAPGQTLHRYYNTPQKMQKVLLYIRRLSPLFAADADPKVLEGYAVCITMTCADGSTHVYRQKTDRYFQSGSGPWQRISPQKDGGLWRILQATPSDPLPRQEDA